jgi:hypothetical protein
MPSKVSILPLALSRIKEATSGANESDSDRDSDDDESELTNNFVMRTRTAGTLAFAPPERITENCLYT